jgi:hypothetical protein
VRRARALALAAPLAATIAVLAGCGGPSADLFEVIRTGHVAGADVDMVVSDGGTVTCKHDGPSEPLSDPLLLQARDYQGDLTAPATKGVSLPAGPDPIYHYEVRTVNGTVDFYDDSPNKPKVFDEMEYLTLQIAAQSCGIQ